MVLPQHKKPAKVPPVSSAKMDCDRHEKNDKAYLSNGGGIQRKSVFGKYSDADMLSWIKGLALDPCALGASQTSIRTLWNQTIKVRKVMALSCTDCPQRKRKLKQFLKDNFAASHRSTSEISDQQGVTNLNNGHLSRATSISCLLNSVDSSESLNQKILNSHALGSSSTSEDNSPGKQIPPEFSHVDDITDRGTPPKKNIRSLVESDESNNSTVPHDPSSLCVDDDSVHSSNNSSSDEPKGAYLQARRRSIRLMNFIGDRLQRMAVPVGPGFQADVPEWTGLANKESLTGGDSDSGNSRWLSTRIWPPKGRTTETNARAVGKGRPDSCPCVSPGSTDCTKRHVHVERLLLRADLGPAFWSWKFDEMGEEVSKSWTLKEQESFDSLAKTYPISHGKDFLKHALKCFPSKGREKILSYYFNVFIPRRMILQTRSP